MPQSPPPSNTVEPWLTGPVPGVDPYLQPAAHALLQASEDLGRAAGDLSPDELAIRPGGAASVAFHLRHIAGSVDRLLTYARGAALSDEQRRALVSESTGGNTPGDAAELIANARAAIAGAIDTLRATPHDSLLDARAVGKQALPSTVLGLLFHVAEHTQRHVGQAIATAKAVRGLR
jgi:uncharacterized damage-inducible protein DinB